MQQNVENLAELVTLLRSNTSAMTTEEAFNYLQDLVGNNIRIRYEVTESTKVDEKSKDKSSGRFSHLNNNVQRVLLTSDRLHAEFHRELSRECNGVVLEYPSWKVLSIPSPMFNPKYRINDIIKHLDKYSIYEINDGTTVTLYWYGGKWCLSSTNGFDVSDYKWMGQFTYKDAIGVVAKQYPEFSFEKLSKDHCYTIGFRHNEFHPLLTDPAKMWLIQVVDLVKINAAVPALSTLQNTDIGLPLQTKAVLPNLSYSELMRWMQNRNREALNKYLNSVREGGAICDIHYGYVLRCSTESLGSGSVASANCNIILESELLKQIRYNMYNLPKRKYTEAVLITSENRLEYTILRAFLNCSAKHLFITLFPQYVNYYHKYDAIFTKLSNRIVSALRNKNNRDMVFKSYKARDTLNSKIDKVAAVQINNIEKSGKVNVMDPVGVNIVMDFIMDKKYLDLYYNCLFGGDESK